MSGEVWPYSKKYWMELDRKWLSPEEFRRWYPKPVTKQELDDFMEEHIWELRRQGCIGCRLTEECSDSYGEDGCPAYHLLKRLYDEGLEAEV